MDNASSGRLARRIARLLALVLVVGGVVSAVPGTGVARMLASAVGYADFGYIPQGCGWHAGTQRAIDGSPVRVCQGSDTTTTGLFPGHYPLLGASRASMYLLLPDQGLTFQCCGSGSVPGGRYVPFSHNLWYSPFGSNPLEATDESSAIYGGKLYATVDQTAFISTGADEYALGYAIQNLSGSSLRLRPVVTLGTYGWDQPALSTTANLRQIRMADPSAGGSVSLEEGAGTNYQPVTGFSAGNAGRVATWTAPNASGLDNTLHTEDSMRYESGRAALTWPLLTVPAGETRYYAIFVEMGQPRDLVLRLDGGAPTADAPAVLDADATDDRVLAGRALRWTRSGAAPTSGAVALDANGHAQISLPPQAGYSGVSAYVDVNGDGLEEDDEPSTGGEVWVPKPAPAPPPPVIVTNTKQTTVTQVVTAPKQLSVTLAFTYRATRTHTRLTKLNVTRVPAGSTVVARCPKGCARKTLTIRNAHGTVSLKALTGRSMKVGQTITVTVTQPGAIGAVKVLKARSRKSPSVSTRCLAPGSTSPAKCE